MPGPVFLMTDVDRGIHQEAWLHERMREVALTCGPKPNISKLGREIAEMFEENFPRETLFKKKNGNMETIGEARWRTEKRREVSSLVSYPLAYSPAE